MDRLRIVCKAGKGLLVAMALAVATAAGAQGLPQPAVPEPSPAAAVLDTELVKTGLYLITGGGGNSLLRLSGNGLIVVNSKLPGNYRALRAQIRRAAKITDQPVRVLFVTDPLDSHSGNNAQFLAAGVPVVVQANAKNRLPAYPSPEGSAATPVFGIDRDYTLRLGGVEVRLLHFGSAHTDGDAVVWFPDLKVIAVGGLYTPDLPVPDGAGGGSLVGWVAVLEQVLRLEFDVVIPDQGPPLNRAALEAFKSRLEGYVSRAGLAGAR